MEIAKEEQAEVLKYVQGLFRFDTHSLVNAVGERDGLGVSCQTCKDWCVWIIFFSSGCPSLVRYLLT